MAIHRTRAEVQAELTALYNCKMSIIRGEAARYTIGTRSVTFISLAQVNAEIKRCEAELEILDGTARARGVRTVVPYDT